MNAAEFIRTMIIIFGLAFSNTNIEPEHQHIVTDVHNEMSRLYGQSYDDFEDIRLHIVPEQRFQYVQNIIMPSTYGSNHVLAIYIPPNIFYMREKEDITQSLYHELVHHYWIRRYSNTHDYYVLREGIAYYYEYYLMNRELSPEDGVKELVTQFCSWDANNLDIPTHDMMSPTRTFVDYDGDYLSLVGFYFAAMHHRTHFQKRVDIFQHMDIELYERFLEIMTPVVHNTRIKCRNGTDDDKIQKVFANSIKG